VTGIDVGLFHRLGVAVRGDGEAPARWFRDKLGARILHSEPEPGDTHWTTMLELGPTNVALFCAAEDDTTGTIGRYLERYGAGLHSLAWRVDDLAGAEALVRDRGFTVTGINREARHWFLHPKETFGILIELTDQQAGQPRRTAPADGPAREVAWMTAVVEDLDPPARLFGDLFGATTVDGLPRPEHADVVDLAIGDVVLRLVAPAESGPYSGGRGLYSMTLRVDDLGAVPFPSVTIADDLASTDPAQTLGLQLEWTTSGATTDE
jgi:catechol 2,3-dioxygenase-like lactoylglutathione lyase family enzyme